MRYSRMTTVNTISVFSLMYLVFVGRYLVCTWRRGLARRLNATRLRIFSGMSRFGVCNENPSCSKRRLARLPHPVSAGPYFGGGSLLGLKKRPRRLTHVFPVNLWRPRKPWGYSTLKRYTGTTLITSSAQPTK